MVTRIDSTAFQIVGLPADIDDPTFRYRDTAEDWLVENMPMLERRMKRGPRPCLSCRKTFVSEGLHNRLCDPCRGGE
jgi:hypothetical protein